MTIYKIIKYVVTLEEGLYEWVRN